MYCGHADGLAFGTGLGERKSSLYGGDGKKYNSVDIVVTGSN